MAHFFVYTLIHKVVLYGKSINMSSNFSSSFASAVIIMATTDPRLQSLKCRVLGWLTTLDFKLKEVQGSIALLEIAMEELDNTLHSTSIIMQSLARSI